MNEAEFKRLGIKPTDIYQRQQPGSKERIAIEAAFHYAKGYAGDSGKSRKDIARYIIENKLLGEMGVNAMVQTITRAIDHLEKGTKIRSGDGGQTYIFIRSEETEVKYVHFINNRNSFMHTQPLACSPTKWP